MKKIIIVALLLLLACMLIIGLSCDKDNGDNVDDDDNEGDDDDFVGETCFGFPDSIYPELISVTAIVNGAEVEMPVTITTADTLTLALEYFDQDCNLDGGYIYIGPNGLNDGCAEGGDAQINELSEYVFLEIDFQNIGCSSEEEGAPYLLELDPADLVIPDDVTRNCPWVIRLYDSCIYENQGDWHNSVSTFDVTVEPVK